MALNLRLIAGTVAWAGLMLSLVNAAPNTTKLPTGTCTKINSCSCAYGNGAVVDLSPLTGNPKWQDQPSSNPGSSFSYNPCASFTEGTCSNVSVCQKQGSSPHENYYPCGTQESATFSDDPYNGLQIKYTQTDATSGILRTSVVSLKCIQSGPDVLQVNGELYTGYYQFTLSSVHCCPRSPTTTVTTPTTTTTSSPRTDPPWLQKVLKKMKSLDKKMNRIDKRMSQLCRVLRCD